MMGRRNQDQGQLFYSFDLDAVVPGDHLVREIAAVLGSLRANVTVAFSMSRLRADSVAHPQASRAPAWLPAAGVMSHVS